MTGTPFYWVNDDTQTFMSRGYLQPGQTPQERTREIAQHAAKIAGDPKLEELVFEVISKGWASLSSPVWSNFGQHGLPISCNGVYMEDDMASIMTKVSEIGIQTKHGAGTSVYMGALRPRGSGISTGGQADGVVSFARLVEGATDVISQGNVRRGNCAAYIDIDSPDIMEFLDIRELHSPVHNLSIGVCVSDDWMRSLIVDGDEEKQKVWMRVLRKRQEKGYPYIFFTDTVNNNAPQVYKDKGRKIHAGNLCNEICLSSTADESFVCNLASMNMFTSDEWIGTHAVNTMIRFLDTVMTEYIDKTEDLRYMESARLFAINQRALGLGTLGWHSYLQSKMIAFESFEARLENTRIHAYIKKEAVAASRELAVELGEPPMLKGYGMRNVTVMAIAPTTSSSFILGQVSPTIEPLRGNTFTKNLAKGKFSYRNPHLRIVLAKYGMDTREVWESINVHAGSVMHLDFLTQHEKSVFKTFEEIDQMVIIAQAADRQRFIDQSQSLNLMVDAERDPSYTSRLIADAWRLGVKGLYYQHSTSPAAKLAREVSHKRGVANVNAPVEEVECTACEA